LISGSKNYLYAYYIIYNKARYSDQLYPRADFHIFLGGGGGQKIQGGGVMIMCRGGSRVFDDRFTRFTQLIGGPGACPPEKI
jgi:hypothetical protein